MAPKILLMSSLGYIGNSILYHLESTYPDYEITAIPRDAPCELPVLEEHATKNDIIIHAGYPDKASVIHALLSGLQTRGKPCFFLHLSSSITVSNARATHNGNDYTSSGSGGEEGSIGFGQLDPRVWSDIDDLEEIRSLPYNHIHRPIDKMIFDATEKYGDHIHTAIICPPDIYGVGPGKTERGRECRMLPLYCDEVSRQKAAIYIGRGENVRSLVHIQDLCILYDLLINNAVDSLASGVIRPECWGQNGFYFASNDEEAAVRDIADAAAKILKSHGLIQHENPRSCSIEEAQDMIDGSGIALYMFGANSRSRADRAKKLLGWEPRGPFFWEEFERDLMGYKGNNPFRDIYPINIGQTI